MKLLLPLCLGISLFASPALDPGLLRARDAQDRASLEKFVAEARAAADKSPQDAKAQYHLAVASSFLAEVAIEQKDKAATRKAADIGIKAAEAAVVLDSNSGEYYRILGTLYGQAIQDIFSGLSYGKKAQDALEKAKQKDPKSSEVWVSDGVGKYYLPGQFGGGPDRAIQSLKRAIELDANNAEAWLWLGLAERKLNQNAEARVSLGRAIALDPGRVWAKQQFDKTPVK